MKTSNPTNAEISPETPRQYEGAFSFVVYPCSWSVQSSFCIHAGARWALLYTRVMAPVNDPRVGQLLSRPSGSKLFLAFFMAGLFIQFVWNPTRTNFLAFSSRGNWCCPRLNSPTQRSTRSSVHSTLSLQRVWSGRDQPMPHTTDEGFTSHELGTGVWRWGYKLTPAIDLKITFLTEFESYIQGKHSSDCLHPEIGNPMKETRMGTAPFCTVNTFHCSTVLTGLTRNARLSDIASHVVHPLVEHWSLILLNSI